MSQKGRSLLVKCGVTALVGGLIAAGVLWLQDIAGAASDLDRIRILSDAFTAPGLLLLLSAALVAVSNQGAFDGISYALKWAIRRLIPGRAATETQESYKEYLERKHQDNGPKGYAFLVITGAVFLAVGIGFTVAFCAISG